jgi:HTH-type transcriptional regulator/antitoxin HigA
MIRALSAGLGVPADCLIGPEVQNSERPPTESSEIDWKKFPYGEMERRGWFKGVQITGKTTEERLQSFLSQVMVSSSSPEVMFRRRLTGIEPEERSYYSTLAWTARVLMRAKEVSEALPRFDPAKIDADVLRDLARLSWLKDGPRIAVDFLAKLGISVVVESRLRNAVLDGAALLSEGGRPVIGLTLRIDRIDYFWFTLLHEVAHVWRHLNDSEETFVDRIERMASLERSPDAKENEANRIAREALIKRAVWERCAARLAPSRENIQSLADQLHIHPAIVAGRIQFESGQYNLFREFLGQGEVKRFFQGTLPDEGIDA